MEEREWWMSDEAEEHIAWIQKVYGFEEDEAVAFWHLAEARRKVVRLLMDDRGQGETEEALEDASPWRDLGKDIAESITFSSKTYAETLHHFSALNAQLGLRVLRRNHPYGWGGKDEPEEE